MRQGRTAPGCRTAVAEQEAPPVRSPAVGRGVPARQPRSQQPPPPARASPRDARGAGGCAGARAVRGGRAAPRAPSAPRPEQSLGTAAGHGSTLPTGPGAVDRRRSRPSRQIPRPIGQLLTHPVPADPHDPRISSGRWGLASLRCSSESEWGGMAGGGGWWAVGRWAVGGGRRVRGRGGLCPWSGETRGRRGRRRPRRGGTRHRCGRTVRRRRRRRGRPRASGARRGLRCTPRASGG